MHRLCIVALMLAFSSCASESVWQRELREHRARRACGIARLRPRAQRGDVSAQRELSKILLTSAVPSFSIPGPFEITTEDRLEGLRWLERVAETGNVAAMLHLADYIEMGWSHPTGITEACGVGISIRADFSEVDWARYRAHACEWRRRAAETGEPMALREFALSFYPDSPSIALEMLRAAARLGDTTSLDEVRSVIHMRPELREVEDDALIRPQFLSLASGVARQFPPVFDETLAEGLDRALLDRLDDEIARAGGDAPRLLALATLCYRERRFDDGRKLAQRALKLDPSNVSARSALTYYFYRRALESEWVNGDWADAGDACTREPRSDFATLMNAGVVSLWHRDGPLALEKWREAKRLRPSDPRPDEYEHRFGRLFGRP